MTAACVYRFFDDEGVLLYVGLTNDPDRRFREHAVGKGWFLRVDHHEVEWFDSRSAAETAEREAIWQERPEFNKANPIVDGRVDVGRSPRALDTVPVAESIQALLAATKSPPET